jgi:D-beta-D-heptose 7-phosphate kinase/D-beta-D-heptose 1-phosphate adenosyltransferase
MQTFEDILPLLGAQTVLCVGDLMLDEFVYGDVSRISPEAATPVLAVRWQQTEIGGAGNVARNVASLGGRCLFVGVVGDDDAGRQLKAAFAAEPRIEAALVADAARPTTRKVRFVSEHHSTHLLRADWERAAPVSETVAETLLSQVRAWLPQAGAVILSDYAKGALTPHVVRSVIDAARALGKPVVVDPKGLDFAIYRGATLTTPNRKELAEATRRPARSDAEVAAAAAVLADIAECDGVLVTRSEDGVTLYRRGGADPVHIPAYPVRVRDVSGPGDTVAAAASLLLAMGADMELAARAANAAAAVVVGKRGTATCSADELRARILPHAVLAAETKVFYDAEAAADHVDEWRRAGLRVGFTNGCFDLLHPGHIKLLTEARAACDRSVTGLKGPNRPIQRQQARAEVLAALEAVDLVVIFDQPTPLELIRRVRPKVLVKGADYRLDQVVGRELVEADGGSVLLVELAAGQSTSGLVAESRKPRR